MEAVFLAYSEGGCSLPQAALTSSFLRIQVHPVPHLPPQAAAVKKKKGSELQPREWVREAWKEMCNRCTVVTQFLLLRALFFPLFFLFVRLHLLPQRLSGKGPASARKRKTQDLPAEWGNTRKGGEKQQAGWRV